MTNKNWSMWVAAATLTVAGLGAGRYAVAQLDAPPTPPDANGGPPGSSGGGLGGPPVPGGGGFGGRSGHCEQVGNERARCKTCRTVAEAPVHGSFRGDDAIGFAVADPKIEGHHLQPRRSRPRAA